MQGRVSAHYPQDRSAYQLPHGADTARYSFPFVFNARGCRQLCSSIKSVTTLLAVFCCRSIALFSVLFNAVKLVNFPYALILLSVGNNHRCHKRNTCWESTSVAPASGVPSTKAYANNSCPACRSQSRSPVRRVQGTEGGSHGGSNHADWLVTLGEQLGGLQAQMQTTASTSSLQAVQHESKLTLPCCRLHNLVY